MSTIELHSTRIGIATVALIALVAAAAAGALAQGAHPGPAGATSAAICRGFVVLPGGQAVLSGPGEPGGEHTHAGPPHAVGGGHPRAPAASARQHRVGEPAPGHGRDSGLQHGQDIVPTADQLCVPIAEAQAQRWVAVSGDATLAVTVDSLRGLLTHNSRANEGFAFTLTRDGRPVQAGVSVFVRMPHHDRTVPGGHGPANDPDVQGLAAARAADGRSVVSTVDFSMPGPWLVEARVEEGGRRTSAYFAPMVGEE
jgi:hypothetical protein